MLDRKKIELNETQSEWVDTCTHTLKLSHPQMEEKRHAPLSVNLGGPAGQVCFVFQGMQCTVHQNRQHCNLFTRQTSVPQSFELKSFCVCVCLYVGVCLSSLPCSLTQLRMDRENAEARVREMEDQMTGFQDELRRETSSKTVSEKHAHLNTPVQKTNWNSSTYCRLRDQKASN